MKSEIRTAPTSKYTNRDIYRVRISPKIANFGDLGQIYRPPVFANGIKWSSGAIAVRHFYKLGAYDVGNSGGTDGKLYQSR